MKATELREISARMDHVPDGRPAGIPYLHGLINQVIAYLIEQESLPAQETRLGPGTKTLEDLESARDASVSDLIKVAAKSVSTLKPVGVTYDPTDPRLGRGVDDKPVPQHEVYLVLSEEERSKGFVRPYRESYQHVGLKPTYPLRDLTPEEKEQYSQVNYVAYEKYHETESSVVGRFWTQAQLDTKGCGSVTTMGRALSETYARDPHFYGSTYCCQCQMHKPVSEFVWTADGQVVGS